MVTSDGHNNEKGLTSLHKSLEFPTKWYTALCNLVDEVLRNRNTNSMFDTFFEETSKKHTVLKDLK